MKLFKTEDFINITEMQMGTAQEQAAQIVERCEEILEMYGFKQFVQENCAELNNRREVFAQRLFKYRAR